MKNQIIKVKGSEIAIISRIEEDYISITDIARYKNPTEPKDIVKNWMRSKTTIDFLGLWEKLHNPDFKGVEFDSFMYQAGSNAFVLSPSKWIEATNAIYASEADLLNVALFGQTAKEWRKNNPEKDGNIRDHAELEQLVVLSNLESINSLLVHQGTPQPERLVKLNETAITQMKSLCTNKNLKKLK